METASSYGNQQRLQIVERTDFLIGKLWLQNDRENFFLFHMGEDEVPLRKVQNKGSWPEDEFGAQRTGVGERLRHTETQENLRINCMNPKDHFQIINALMFIPFSKPKSPLTSHTE